ncbi:MAG: hypothetical protein ACFFCW_11455, partial [Candidatus Hodarchaeota archaeon]
MNKKIVILTCTWIFMLFPIFSAYVVTSASGIEELTEPVYLEIAEYYDNRKAVVTVTADDWQQNTWQEFEAMSQMLAAKHIYYTGAIITNTANWTQIQYWLN